jgi:hypothetical protein
MDGQFRLRSYIKTLAPLPVLLVLAAAALANVEHFDAVTPGTLPNDWTCGVTGMGSPVWKVENGSVDSEQAERSESIGDRYLSLVREEIRSDHRWLCRGQVQTSGWTGGSGRRSSMAIQGQ